MSNSCASIAITERLKIICMAVSQKVHLKIWQFHRQYYGGKLNLFGLSKVNNAPAPKILRLPSKY